MSRGLQSLRLLFLLALTLASTAVRASSSLDDGWALRFIGDPEAAGNPQFGSEFSFEGTQNTVIIQAGHMIESLELNKCRKKILLDGIGKVLRQEDRARAGIGASKCTRANRWGTVEIRTPISGASRIYWCRHTQAKPTQIAAALGRCKG